MAAHPPATVDPHAAPDAGQGAADAAAHAAAAGGHEASGGFPPFEIGLFASQLFWFVVTFVASWYARELNEITIIGPLGFYMGAQGAPVIYLLIIWWYARYMNNLDREYGVSDGESEE